MFENTFIILEKIFAQPFLSFISIKKKMYDHLNQFNLILFLTQKYLEGIVKKCFIKSLPCYRLTDAFPDDLS